MPVHCGLESPPLRARVVALQSRMVLAARIHLVGVGTGREGSGQETSCGKCTACLLVYYFFLQKFWWISRNLLLFLPFLSVSLSRVSPIFSLCLRSLRVCRRSRNLFWSRYSRNIVFWSFLWSRGSLVSDFFPPLSFNDFFLDLHSGDFKLFVRMQQQQQALFCELLLSPWTQIEKKFLI
jgi:hypothetical protein